MIRNEVSEQVRTARNLAECQIAADVLTEYLRIHPDDEDLRDEGSGLYMKLTALQQTASAPTPFVLQERERVA